MVTSRPEPLAPASSDVVIRVLIADDHAMVRGGLRRIIESEPGLCVSAEAQDGASALASLRTVPCDVLMLDLSMPAPGGPELIGTIRRQWPALPILVVSMHADVRIVRAAIDAGASGYVTKDSDPETLISALRRVVAGGRYLGADIEAALLPAPLVRRRAHDQLTPRERQVFARLVAGQSNQDIARDLYLSEKTISTHKMNLMAKLGLRSMVELVRYADDHPCGLDET